MSWIAVILLALLAFTAAVGIFRLDKALWTSVGALLLFGLAGYAWQANPALPSAPKPTALAQDDGFDTVEARSEFIAADERSAAPFLITADAMARRGRHADAAQMTAGIVRQYPNDFEAWLAQGIALTQHADGALTPPALYAFRQAATLRPDHPAPGYFVGLAMVRQGRLAEARAAWAETLATTAPDAEGRAALEERLGRLDEVLRAMQPGAQAPAGG